MGSGEAAAPRSLRRSHPTGGAEKLREEAPPKPPGAGVEKLRGPTPAKVRGEGAERLRGLDGPAKVRGPAYEGASERGCGLQYPSERGRGPGAEGPDGALGALGPGRGAGLPPGDEPPRQGLGDGGARHPVPGRGGRGPDRGDSGVRLAGPRRERARRESPRRRKDRLHPARSRRGEARHPGHGAPHGMLHLRHRRAGVPARPPVAHRLVHGHGRGVRRVDAAHREPVGPHVAVDEDVARDEAPVGPPGLDHHREAHGGSGAQPM